MDKKAIETLSINAVRDSIVTCGLLDQFIADNDKEPSWDGFVYIYKNRSKTKDKLLGRLPVQVKGTENNDFSRSEITFPVSVTDPTNYLYDGGVVFFVVYVGSKGFTNKIYYIELVPIKLRNLLKNAKKQKTKTIKLQEFPSEENKKTNIFYNCYDNCKKQASFTNAKLLTLKELEQKGVLQEIQFFVSGVGIKKDPIEALLANNETYTYAKISGSDVPQPLEFFLRI